MTDESLLSGFVTVSDKGDDRLRDLVSQAPGKQSFGDDEMPDVLYSVRYHDLNGKVIDCECFCSACLIQSPSQSVC